MRKALFILAIAALSLVSCNKEIPIDLQEVDEEPITNVVFKLTANHPEGTTKAVKTGWENGDVIFVFFNNIASPRYLKMSYDGSDWNYTQMNGVSEESLGLVENATGTMRAIFLPFASDADISANGTSFIFSETTYSYYLTATLDYTVTGGEVSGAFNMQIPSGYIQFFLDDASASPSTEIELREPHLTPQGIASIAANGTITHTSIASGAPLPGYVYDKVNKTGSDALGYLFSGVLSAGAQNKSTNYLFTLVSGGWEGNYYSKAFNAKTWYRSESEGRALKMPALSIWTAITNYKPIDLGTDQNGKRIYWCSCNVGASSPEDYGNHYAWGEIEPNKAYYGWSNYKWCNGSRTSMTKYNSDSDLGVVDGKSRFSDYNYVDDAARQSLGGLWRTPIRSELSKLASLTWTETTQKGIHGVLVTGKLSGYTSRSIFLPAAGQWNLDSKDDGSLVYWSAERRGGEYNDEAYSLSYAFEVYPYPSTDSDNRYYGQPIRPICD